MADEILVQTDHRNWAVSEACGCIHGTRGGVHAIQYCRVHREAAAMAELLREMTVALEKRCEWENLITDEDAEAIKKARALLARIGVTT